MSVSLTTVLGPARPGALLRLLARAPEVPPWPEGIECAGGIPIVRLRGTAGERAERHGRLLAPQIRLLLSRYLGLFMGPARARFLETADRLEAFLEDSEREQIAGLHRGLDDLDLDEVRLAATFLDAHKVALCSTIVTRDRRSGRPLFGRNLDFPSFGVAHRLGAVFVTEARDGIPYAAVGWPGLLGVLSGLNREGLALALNLVYGEADAPDGVPLTFAMRRVLARATDLAAAEEILRATRFASSNNVTVCDACGEAAVFEVGPDRFHVRRADGPIGATNHRASCRRLPRPTPLSCSSHFRYRRLGATRAALATRASVPEVIRALRRAAMPFITLQSMVFHPAERAIRLSTGRVPAARGSFTLLDRDTLFGEDGAAIPKHDEKPPQSAQRPQR